MAERTNDLMPTPADSQPILQVILTSGAVSAAVTALVNFLFKRSENDQLRAHNAELESIRSQLRSIEEADKIKLGLLQEKRVAAVLEIYDLIARAEETVTLVIANGAHRNLTQEESDEFANAAIKGLTAFRLRVSELGVLFPEDVLDKLLKLVDDLAQKYSIGRLYAESPTPEDRVRLANTDWRPIRKSIKEMRAEMRTMLGALEK